MLIPLFERKEVTQDCGIYRGMKLIDCGMEIVEWVFERRPRSS